MCKVYAIAADGCEECELLIPIDLMRRADINVETVSVDGAVITSSHGVKIVSDRLFSDVTLSNADAIFIPGGMPGSKRLGENSAFIEQVKAAYAGGKTLAAICAAPALVLGEHGLLRGKSATCAQGFEEYMQGCELLRDCVVVCGNVITASSLAFAYELGLTLVQRFKGDKARAEVERRTAYSQKAYEKSVVRT